MKSKHLIQLMLSTIFITACSSSGIGASNIFATDTPLPTAPIGITPAPDARAAVNNFFDALKQNNYEAMYAMLSQAGQSAISLEDFSKRWNDALNEMSAANFEVDIVTSQISPLNAEVGYSITYQTVLAGDIQRNIIMRLVNENNNWKVQWDDGLILPELAGGNLLAMEYSIPARGDIYDKDGLPLVTQKEALAFGIQTDLIDLDLRGTLTTEMGLLCGFDPLDIENQIDASGPGWYLPMCEGTRDDAQRLLSINPGGLVATEYESRFYEGASLAAHVVGYTLPIFPEQLNDYKRKGYSGSERIGQDGIEAWAEDYLGDRKSVV
jgi:penicillin-binding protein 2